MNPVTSNVVATKLSSYAEVDEDVTAVIDANQLNITNQAYTKIGNFNFMQFQLLLIYQ